MKFIQPQEHIGIREFVKSPSAQKRFLKRMFAHIVGSRIPGHLPMISDHDKVHDAVRLIAE